MSVVRVVPKEDFEIIKKYLFNHDSQVVVLVPEEVAKRNQLTHLDGEEVDYDCGGDADFWVDVVSSDGHYFIKEMKEIGESE
jgi:hypothetical protein